MDCTTAIGAFGDLGHLRAELNQADVFRPILHIIGYSHIDARGSGYGEMARTSHSPRLSVRWIG